LEDAAFDCAGAETESTQARKPAIATNDRRPGQHGFANVFNLPRRSSMCGSPFDYGAVIFAFVLQCTFRLLNSYGAWRINGWASSAGRSLRNLSST
jgi:hypothetical protein